MIEAVVRSTLSCVLLTLFVLAPGPAFGDDYCRIEGIEWVGVSGEGSGIGGTGHSGEGSGLGGTGHSDERSGIGGTGYASEGSGLGGTGYEGDPGSFGDPGVVDEESGMGGIGVFGTITRFGSVCVNGLHVFFDDSVAVRLNDLDVRGSEALELGQMVWLVAMQQDGRLVTDEIDVLGDAENGIDFEDLADWVIERIKQDPRIERISIEGTLERGPHGQLWIQGLPLDLSGLPLDAREFSEGSPAHVRLMGPLGPDGQLRVRLRSTPLPPRVPHSGASPPRMMAPAAAATNAPTATLAPRPGNVSYGMPAFAVWSALVSGPLDPSIFDAPRPPLQAPARAQQVEGLETVVRPDSLEQPARPTFQRVDRPERPQRPTRLDRPVRPDRLQRPERPQRPPRRGHP